LQVCGEFIRLEISHQAIGFHFFTTRVKKENGGRADDAKLLHQCLVHIIIGRDICLQQVKTLKLCPDPGLGEGIAFHATHQSA